MKSILWQNVSGIVKFGMILFWRVSGFIKHKDYYKIVGVLSLANCRSETCTKKLQFYKIFQKNCFVEKMLETA